MRKFSLFVLALGFASPLLSTSAWVADAVMPPETPAVAPAAAVVEPAPAPVAAHEPLAVNDIAWLFPMPKTTADLATAISLKDVVGPPDPGATGPTPAWADSAMKQYFGLIDKFGGVAGQDFRINLSERVRNRAVWHIAGVRLDPGAPGLSPAIVEQFGRQPQLRLIVQPIVDDGNGGIQVLDIAAHLIFSFTTGRDAKAKPGCFERPVPDMAKVKALGEDARAMRDALAKGSIGGDAVLTKDKLLGLHPGFASAKTAAGFRNEVLGFLNKHLPTSRLTSMAVAGLPDDFGEPWMFMATFEDPPNSGVFKPAPSPALGADQFKPPMNFDIALSFITDVNVLPAPAPNNLMPVTCEHSALNPPVLTGRKGLATAELFVENPDKARVKEIVDLIGDPARSHFFNTDCVSCHTDTRLGVDELGLGTFSGIEKDALPKSQWNVRNFGWFPAEGPTATNRTLQETRESLLEFNRLLAAP